MNAYEELSESVEQALDDYDRDGYPEMVDVEDLMTAPEGMVQVGDEFRVVDEEAAPDVETKVVGVCEVCGKKIEDTLNDWSYVGGHGCADGFRNHPNGEGIREVGE